MIHEPGRSFGEDHVVKNSMNFARKPGLIVYFLTSTIIRATLVEMTDASPEGTFR
jgi:hypothetical protein